MGVYFYPRGGSAHVCRALATEFERNGSEVTVLSGSRSDLGEHALASSFYSGLDLRAVDFTPALRSGSPLRFDGAEGTAPMHGSYEDRPGAEDPVLASLDDEAYELQVEACTTAETPTPTVVNETPRITPPSTDSGMSNGSSGQNGLPVVLMAIAGILAAAVVLTPRRQRSRP